jgi:hypothetical protein
VIALTYAKPGSGAAGRASLWWRRQRQDGTECSAAGRCGGTCRRGGSRLKRDKPRTPRAGKTRGIHSGGFPISPCHTPLDEKTAVRKSRSPPRSTKPQKPHPARNRMFSTGAADSNTTAKVADLKPGTTTAWRKFCAKCWRRLRRWQRRNQSNCKGRACLWQRIRAGARQRQQRSGQRGRK